MRAVFHIPIIAAAALLATVLCLEALFRCLPVSTATLTGYYFDADLLTYPARHEWAVATGWDMRNAQHLRSNAQGFAADIDFVADPQALALIGDSYVEGSALRQQDRPAAQLARYLRGKRVVYGMGTPGTALLDYAQRIRYASQSLQTRDFVVWLEAGDARQALCGTGHVVSRCLDARTLLPRTERLAPPDAIKRLARHSALAQYVFSQLKFNPGRLLSDMRQALSPARAVVEGATPADTKAMQAMVDAVLAEFFRQVAPHARGRLLFIVDGHRAAPPKQPTALHLERQYLVGALRAAGAEVLDLETVFEAHRNQSKLSPEVGPYDHHLNPLGVRLVMQAVATRLEP